ncbi:AMP-binding protein, partial [Amycolatopsis sp. NPDC102389]|uniref:AMP-binding protein n=1 Tax=Amycolatopsis sp. NPDC102389 TaxID=3363941 RepID=UPI00380514C2
ERGAVPGDTVAISLPKGPDQLVGVLGVLAAGCTYVPIGVDQPAARRERMLGLAKAELVVTADLLAQHADPLPACRPAAELAYVIFTSGSTGEPKGVETTHRAALNTVADINERFAVGPEDRLLAVSALDFDLSVYDIFGPLSVEADQVAMRWTAIVAATTQARQGRLADDARADVVGRRIDELYRKARKTARLNGRRPHRSPSSAQYG